MSEASSDGRLFDDSQFGTKHNFIADCLSVRSAWSDGLDLCAAARRFLCSHKPVEALTDSGLKSAISFQG